MNILGVHTGHDAAAALFVNGELVASCKEERLTRMKNDGIKRRDSGRLLLYAVDEVLQIAGLNVSEIDMMVLSRSYLPARFFRKTARMIRDLPRRLRNKPFGLTMQMHRLNEKDEAAIIDIDKLKAELGLRDDCKVQFANHHFSHVLCSFRYTTWEKDALYISADGGGDFITYSAYGYDGEQLQCLQGGDQFIWQPLGNRYAASIGQAYSFVTRLLGFRPNRHEGKLTGLAAFGKPVFGEDIRSQFVISEDGSIESRFDSSAALLSYLKDLTARCTREEMASSIQYVTEHVLIDWIKVLMKRFPARYIGMSGGVFSNVRLNQFVAELEGVEDVFVFPAMGDEGLPVGNCVQGMINENGLASISRSVMRDVYLGREYSGEQLMRRAQERSFDVQSSVNAAVDAAALLAEDHIGAIFSQRMEMGPRALGARSIIASPSDRGLNDSLNDRLERTEFMPFAPYVLDEDAERVFDIDDRNRQACRFMTITTGVKEAFRDSIQAVVHVDNTARPQIVERDTNPLYYDILKNFRDQTGLPCLVNTSFNAHEEPIINTPDEALRALADRRIDFLVCDQGLIFRQGNTLVPRANSQSDSGVDA